MPQGCAPRTPFSGSRARQTQADRAARVRERVQKADADEQRRLAVRMPCCRTATQIMRRTFLRCAPCRCG
jgi:hypothetical protein